jgi:Predicted dioxygenase of extradiol dioxygenase family
MSAIFHLAFPVHDLDAAHKFYVEGLGCAPGRRSTHSLILNLAGNQIVAQLSSEALPKQQGIYPRHFGLILAELKEWEALAQRVREQGMKFYQEPKLRFPGSPTEHRTFFLQDPSGNLLEFKHYSHASAIFGETEFPQVGDR